MRNLKRLAFDQRLEINESRWAARPSDVLEETRGGGGVWGPKVCAPKMARPDFPMVNFVLSTKVTLVWGGGSRGGQGTLLRWLSAVLTHPSPAGCGGVTAGWGAECPRFAGFPPSFPPALGQLVLTTVLGPGPVAAAAAVG